VSITGQGLAFSPDGATLAVGSDRSIQIWDVAGRRLRRSIPTGRAIVRQLAFAPDGSGVASAGDTPAVTNWDPESGRAVTRFDWDIGKIASLAFAPDGLTAAAGGSNRKFVVWDLDR
jgi:WD40 repeat protein